MRVIAGKCRGTKLTAPEGMETRPTIDRIKETLFNMIAFDIPECQFLDLYSGSGGMGIESLSRGAQHAVFVDQSDKAIQCIQQNLEKTKLKEAATVLKTSAHDAILDLAHKGKKFDIIFMDPPYALEEIENILHLIQKKEILSPDGYIILERSTNRVVNIPDDLLLWKEKRYKTTTLTWIKMR